jgi:hypothetical protein
MKIDKNGVYVAVTSFAGNTFAVKRGMRLRGDNPAVAAAPMWFIPAEGATEDAMVERVRENEHAAEIRRDKNRAAAIEVARKVGTRWLAGDDITAEAAKRAARANGDLELVYDEGGAGALVIGVRLRESAKERNAKHAQDAATGYTEANRAALAAAQTRREA